MISSTLLLILKKLFTLTKLKNLNDDIKTTIHNVIDEKAMENDQVSASEVKSLLSDFQKKVTEEVKDLISEMKNYVNKESSIVQPIITNALSNLYYSFIHVKEVLNIQKMYQVPKSFKFPSCNKKQG